MTRYWHAGNVRLSTGGSWQDHLDRGSPGGEDFPLAHGTIVYAPDTGRLRFRSAYRGEGSGQVLELLRPDGVMLTLFHASDGFGVTLNGGWRQAVEGEPAGRSGGKIGTPSQGLSTGPHAHEHAVVNGRRVPISSLIGSSGGGGSGVPQEEEMTQAQVDDIKQAIRRESRPRLYRNTSDGQQMAIRVETGYVRIFSSVPDRDVLIALGVVAPETAMDVAASTYNGLIGEANKQLARIAASVAAAFPRAGDAQIDAIVEAIQAVQLPAPDWSDEDLAAIGRAVNLSAVEKALQVLTQQVEDLDRSDEELLDAIAGVPEQTRQKLAEALTA